KWDDEAPVAGAIEATWTDAAGPTRDNGDNDAGAPRWPPWRTVPAEQPPATDAAGQTRAAGDAATRAPSRPPRPNTAAPTGDAHAAADAWPDDAYIAGVARERAGRRRPRAG